MEMQKGDVECRVSSGDVYVFPRLTLAATRGNHTLQTTRRLLDKIESTEKERQLRIMRLSSEERQLKAQIDAGLEHGADMEGVGARRQEIIKEYEQIATDDLRLNDDYIQATAEFVFEALKMRHLEFQGEDGKETFEETFDLDDLFAVYDAGYLRKKKQHMTPAEAEIFRIVMESEQGGELLLKELSSTGGEDSQNPIPLDAVSESYASPT